MEELKAAILQAAKGADPSLEPDLLPVRVGYGEDLEGEVAMLAEEIRRDEALAECVPPLWTALRVLEGVPDALEAVCRSHARHAIERQAEASRVFLEHHLGTDVATFIAERRYGFARGLVKETMYVYASGATPARTLTDRLDAVLTHRLLGIPIFLAVMVAVYALTFMLGKYPQDWINWGFGALQSWTSWGLQGHEDAGALGAAQGEVVALEDQFHGIPQGRQLLDLHALAAHETHRQEALADALLRLYVVDSAAVPHPQFAQSFGWSAHAFSLHFPPHGPIRHNAGANWLGRSGVPGRVRQPFVSLSITCALAPGWNATLDTYALGRTEQGPRVVSSILAITREILPNLTVDVAVESSLTHGAHRYALNAGLVLWCSFPCGNSR